MSLSRASFRKIAAATAVICDELGGSVGRLDLMKILYAADRESLSDHERTITGDTYFSMKHGPILSSTLSLAKDKGEAKQQAEWGTAFKNEGVNVVLLKGVKVDTDALSEYDETLIRKKAQELTKLKAAIGPKRFIEMLHNEWQEWEDPGDSCIYLPLIEVLTDGLSIPEREARRIAAEDAHAKSVLDESKTAGKPIVLVQ